MRAAQGGHAGLMDGIYRRQRHIYDATRKYYLLGRDHLIAELAPPPGGRVLEVACGTGRNLIQVARRYPDCQLYGLDISQEMLRTARAAIAARGLEDRVELVQADACAFDPQGLFGVAEFDRVFLSYSLSMIPDWEAALAGAAAVLAPGGELHVVDFGGQSRLPGWFKRGLRRWLAKFHVAPRDDLGRVMEDRARERALAFQFTPLMRDYAQYGRLGRLPN